MAVIKYVPFTNSLVEEHLRFSCSLLLGNTTPQVASLPAVATKKTTWVVFQLSCRTSFQTLVWTVCDACKPIFSFSSSSSQGCPFRHNDPELLKQKLQNYKVSPSGINQVCPMTSTHLTRFSTMRVKGFLKLNLASIKMICANSPLHDHRPKKSSK